MPSEKACWRKAPTVRFINFEIFATGVFALECLRSSACRVFVQRARFTFAVFFAMCPPEGRPSSMRVPLRYSENVRDPEATSQSGRNRQLLVRMIE
jgi:hypothetical protein